jgi:hypothetical protein
MFGVRQPARGVNLGALTVVHASVRPPAYFRGLSFDKSSIGARGEPLAPAWLRPSRAIANPLERDVANEARCASTETRESFQAMTN